MSPLTNSVLGVLFLGVGVLATLLMYHLRGATSAANQLRVPAFRRRNRKTRFRSRPPLPFGAGSRISGAVETTDRRSGDISGRDPHDCGDGAIDHRAHAHGEEIHLLGRSADQGRPIGQAAVE